MNATCTLLFVGKSDHSCNGFVFRERLGRDRMTHSTDAIGVVLLG